MYHMVVEYPNSLWNITDDHKYISAFSNLRHSKIYPNWDFWFEKKPSGNPVPDNGFTSWAKSDRLQTGAEEILEDKGTIIWNCLVENVFKW
jgi:hypothetical protein